MFNLDLRHLNCKGNNIIIFGCKKLFLSNNFCFVFVRCKYEIFRKFFDCFELKRFLSRKLYSNRLKVI